MRKPRILPADPEALETAIREKEIPSSAQGVFRSAFTGNSRAAAVKAFCLECNGFDRAAVRDCPVRTCPLWRFRPFRFSKATP